VTSNLLIREPSEITAALADFRTADGRSGVGWIEWNVNQRGYHRPQPEADTPQFATAP
jgi:hypothetical protein